MENVAGEKSLALQQRFPYKSSYSFQSSDRLATSRPHEFQGRIC